MKIRTIALATGLTLAMGAAAQTKAPQQVVKPPVSQAWIDVATFTGMGMPMGGQGGKSDRRPQEVVMKRTGWIFAVFLVMTASLASAQEKFGVPVYPGAKYDEATSKALKESMGFKGLLPYDRSHCEGRRVLPEAGA